MHSNINPRLGSVLAEVFGLRPDQIVLGLTKETVGSWDSLKQMDLVVSIEQEFDITLEIPDIVKMDSIASIISVLTSKGVDVGP